MGISMDVYASAAFDSTLFVHSHALLSHIYVLYCWILWLALSTPGYCVWPLECIKMLFIRVCKYRRHRMIPLNLIEKFSEMVLYFVRLSCFVLFRFVSFVVCCCFFVFLLPDNCPQKKLNRTIFDHFSLLKVYMISLNTCLTIFSTIKIISYLMHKN